MSIKNEYKEISFNTKYGKVKMTSPTPTAHSPSSKTTKMEIGGISDNPFNTFGLASKVFVNKSTTEHNNDNNAHKAIIDGLIARIEKLEAAVGLNKK